MQFDDRFMCKMRYTNLFGKSVLKMRHLFTNIHTFFNSYMKKHICNQVFLQFSHIVFIIIFYENLYRIFEF